MNRCFIFSWVLGSIPAKRGLIKLWCSVVPFGPSAVGAELWVRQNETFTVCLFVTSCRPARPKSSTRSRNGYLASDSDSFGRAFPSLPVSISCPATNSNASFSFFSRWRLKAILLGNCWVVKTIIVWIGSENLMLLLVSLQLLIAMKYFDSLVYYTPSRSFDNLNWFLYFIFNKFSLYFRQYSDE